MNSNRAYMHGYCLPCKWLLFFFSLSSLYLWLTSLSFSHSFFTSLSSINSLSKPISLSDPTIWSTSTIKYSGDFDGPWKRRTMIPISLSHLRSHENDRLSRRTMIRRSKALTQWTSVIPMGPWFRLASLYLWLTSLSSINSLSKPISLSDPTIWSTSTIKYSGDSDGPWFRLVSLISDHMKMTDFLDRPWSGDPRPWLSERRWFQRVCSIWSLMVAGGWVWVILGLC